MRRAGMTGAATSLDFAAILAIASAQGADVELIADALPELEMVMLTGMSGDFEEDES